MDSNRPKQSARRAETMSTRALARAIGVSESSIKRWVDDGSLRSARTVGGHRRIARADAIRFVRERHATVVHPEALGLVELADIGLPPLATGGSVLADLLERGADRQALAVLVGWYLAGESLAAICDQPLRTALDHLGTLWTRDRTGIFLEHRAIQICIRALTELRDLVPTSSDVPVAIGGAVPGDPYLLPSMAAALVLQGEGFEAVNLGADVPLTSLADALDQVGAKIVWVSASVVADGRALAGEVARLADQAAARAAHVVVGGRGARDLSPLRAPNLLVGSSMSELAAFARGLRAVDAQR